MKKRFKYSIALCLVSMLSLVGCSENNDEPNVENIASTQKIEIVATTTMLQDLCEIIGGDKVNSTGLLAVGIDPHIYQPSAKDTTILSEADVIVYNGLHLEGKMGEIFAHMESQNKFIISAEDAIDEKNLLADEEDLDSSDPHIWFDTTLWIATANHISDELSIKDPENAEYYAQNAENYIVQLNELDEYISEKIALIPEDSRVLITAHDAFGYFANRYDFEVYGIQGIATTAEATTKDLSDLADFIVEREIKAVFVETSVSSKNMEALKEAVEAQGFNVNLGGELYSDSLGEGLSYIETYQKNIDTIVNALK